MAQQDQKLSLTVIVEAAAKLPYARVNREEFLRKNLNKLCTPEQLKLAISDGTLRADIPMAKLDSIANAVINAETRTVTAVSFSTGIPGGWAIAISIPTDLVNFYAHVIRIAQELAYIYGWDELFQESQGDQLDDGTESELVLFIGAMFGVDAAKKAISKLFGEAATKSVQKKVVSMALTKTWYYPIAKKIAAMLGQKLTKDAFAKAASKIVPLIGAFASGALTYAMFKSMAHRLQKHLSSLAHMTSQEYAEYEATIEIDADAIIADADVIEIEEVLSEVDGTNYWICDCGSENKGKFCEDCGAQKPAALPQYRCDKCCWEPANLTMPPKYCPECGDPFDDGDIIV